MQKLLEKYPFLRFLKNKYALVLFVFIIWMLFLDNYSYLDQHQLNNQIDALEINKTYYQQEINKDKKSIRILKNSGQVEKYAREKYFMKRDSEDIYIIDIEKDRIKDSIQKPNNR